MFKWLGGLVDSNEKEIKRLIPLVDIINSLEPEFEKLSDSELCAKTSEFKERIAQVTAQAREELNKAEDELDSARKCEVNPLDQIAQGEQAKQCKSLEEQIQKREDELKQAENQALDDLLPEAFAAVREAARRTIKQRHFDVQLMGGIILHQGKIAEMKTGEGKTLVATLPLYLNSLTGRGCHLATVNDYLARRDPYWMGSIYSALGVTVASIYPQQSPDDYTPARVYDPAFDSGDKTWTHFRPIKRREAYQADITYGTSSEFGFDYLRDNMVIEQPQCVQRVLNYAIVDEVDNLLIDEARTPLIISGPAQEAGDLYKAVDNVVNRLKVKVLSHESVTSTEKEEEAALEAQYDYIAYEKERNVKETAQGQEKFARAFGMRVTELFGGEEEAGQTSIEEARKRNALLSIFRNSMKAHALFRLDRDYVVKDDEVILVDEFTGRLMIGRRYSEGLHQAIEAKEHVRVQRETLTYATITIQNYFRMYQKLGGMTGTAATEAEEFSKIYKLEVVAIPTNKPMIREDFPDRIYKDEKAKFNAAAAEIEKLSKEGRPILVGTVSIEKSVLLSDLLKRRGVQCRVLNAKEHEKEASIIADAGKPGNVTVATNMAGRGVDIILGGKEPEKPSDGDVAALKAWEKEHADWEKMREKVLMEGGLHVLGTERHEARRIDNQLRGRAGRQGDPGSTRFYVSLEDSVVKMFGGERIKGFMEWAGMDEHTPIENKLVNKSIENSQVRVEGYHFDMRKHLVEYDDVVNKHRELIYCERKKILSGADLKANIQSMVKKELQALIATHIAGKPTEEVDFKVFINDVNAIIPIGKDFTPDALSKLSTREIEEKLLALVDSVYEQREQEFGAEKMRLLERITMLRIIDSLWIEHLTALEDMRQQAGWQTLRQVKAVDAYKSQGYQQFQVLLSTIQNDVAHTIFHVKIQKQEEPVSTPVSQAARAGGGPSKQALKVGGQKVGRNDPCPCGSGKKYKRCCGK